jgi:Rad3-related DNA helicase
MSEILNYFPRKLTPRPVQENALKELERLWDKGNIFVINLPVASGKSACAMSIAHWKKRCSIITPSKLLVDQYKDEYNYVHVLRAKSDYWCDTFKCTVNKRPKVKKLGATCKKDLGCSGCQAYLKDLRKARVMPYLLSNYHIYLSHKLYRDVLVVDEAHNLINMLKNMAAKKFWQFKYQFPDSVRTREEIKRWVNSLPDSAFNYHFQQSGERIWAKQDSLEFLREEINSYRPRYLITVAEENLRGEKYRCIKMTPLDISDAPPIMWPNEVKKIVFLSATISRKDIEQLGLSGKKIQYIQADSPIHAERRPVIIPPKSTSLAFRVQDQNLPELCKFIEETAVHNDAKGLIHATYGLAKKMKEYNWNPEIRERLIFHNREDKAAKYNEFRNSRTGKILVASGMYEGIDLPYDAGRWQVVAKVPWPSLADPAIKFLCNEDDEWYAWETIKTVLQACGRICRTPEDHGVTYIYDNTFKRLYQNNLELFPKWLQDSVKGV